MVLREIPSNPFPCDQNGEIPTQKRGLPQAIHGRIEPGEILRSSFVNYRGRVLQTEELKEGAEEKLWPKIVLWRYWDG